jgi:tetratricopeptide (TPR) repeat protein
MDNALRAWELPGPMRWALLALMVAMTAFAVTRTASATEARAAVDAANAALTAEPPKRDVARAALSRATAANDDPTAVGEAYFQLGELDEGDGAFEQAMVDDRAAIDAAPNTRWALRASDRIDWLRARSEGGFAPLRRLENVRRDPAASSDPAAVEALAHDLESFPPGAVRVEARMLVAEAWFGRMHRPGDAIGELRLVAQDPKADPLTQRLAERELVDALVATGRIDEAAAEATSHKNRLDPRFVRQVGRLIVRRTVWWGSLGVLAAFGLLAVAGLVRAGMRRRLGTALRELRKLSPVAALFVAFVAVAGGVLASKYESGNAAPFLILGAGVLPLLLVARAWSAVGSQTSAARAARALLCGATVIAAAFMLLDWFGPQYLSGFGL